ncbi:cytochrome ubiquinol oxidase subunit I [Streptomyces achromogenes]|uniref:cytochrome ubiquinol oxidase subunit I n=1 Tax=Streptomyces achromogenes TaxID=67255 RepID=UPI0036FBF69D
MQRGATARALRGHRRTRSAAQRGSPLRFPGAPTASTTVVELSRWQFAITPVFHMTFPALTVGLSVLLAGRARGARPGGRSSARRHRRPTPPHCGPLWKWSACRRFRCRRR